MRRFHQHAALTVLIALASASTSASEQRSVRGHRGADAPQGNGGDGRVRPLED